MKFGSGGHVRGSPSVEFIHRQWGTYAVIANNGFTETGIENAHCHHLALHSP
jgi:hypothetical protein